MNMQRMRLDGQWRLEYGPKTAAGWSGEPQSLSATVPGNVEIDLMKAGALPDLFHGCNVLAARPFEFYDWVYRKSFAVPHEFRGRRVELVFHGVDCIAAYALNGRDIGRSENALIEHRFDVTSLLDFGGENQIEVRIASAVNWACGRPFDPDVRAFAMESAVLRKPAHAFGWDIMPRLVSAGIWRPVELVAHAPTELVDAHFFTLAVHEHSAEVGFRYRFATDAPILEGFEIMVAGRCGEAAFAWRGAAPFTVGEVAVTVPDARLWWPRGYGAAHLYDVQVSLMRDGQVVDTRAERIGIRTIELVRTDLTTRERPGEFLFKVNGRPIMCKGSNWVPLDALHSRDAERVSAGVELLRDLGCNIVRCWGGNVYEDHAFFELCDRHGIMVWQDFAMACARYPQDAGFRATLADEAAAVIRKLRNHPSLALWSGDNECDSPFIGYADPGQNALTREVLPAAVRQHDFRRPYLPSSPYLSPELVKLDRMDESLSPEQHLWGPRDYYKSKFYSENTAHFASEIGYHGCPNVSSIRKFIAPAHLWPWTDNEQWRIHATDSSPQPGPYAYRIKLMADQIREMFGFAPDNLEDFALASQISQAEAKKFFIELFRLAKWRRTGIVWWNALDGWPQFSDAVVDYYFGKKLAYHYIKRVQTPVCVMVGEPEGWQCRVVLGNDTLEAAVGTFRVSDADSGGVLLEGPFDAAANRNTVLGSIRVSHGEHRLFLIEWECGGRTYGNHYLLGKPPLSFDRYREWLKRVAALPVPFDARAVAR